MGDRTRTGSAQVAAELIERIRDGSLGPGDRVPSTREIVRDWGVAMATATKALTALRTDGWVRPVPGVGTVVVGVPSRPHGAPPRHRPADPSPNPAPSAAPSTEPAGLSTERVVAAGLAVADAEGLAALSMRRVGAELGVAPMSLYRHVRDKDDLLVHMMNAAFDEWTPPPDGTPIGWRERIERVCRAMWERFRRHPWLASALSLTRPQALVGGMVYTDQILAGLTELGLGPTRAFDAHLILLNYIRGLAVSVESEQQAEADSGRSADEWVDEHRSDTAVALDARPAPALRAVIDALGESGYDLDLDRLFETGLRHLVDGLGADAAGVSGRTGRCR